MLLLIAVILLIAWAGGFALNVVGSFVHVLLVLALIVVVAHFLLGRRAG